MSAVRKALAEAASQVYHSRRIITGLGNGLEISVMNHLRAFTITLSLFATVIIYERKTNHVVAISPFDDMDGRAIARMRFELGSYGLSNNTNGKCYAKFIDEDLPQSPNYLRDYCH